MKYTVHALFVAPSRANGASHAPPQPAEVGAAWPSQPIVVDAPGPRTAAACALLVAGHPPPTDAGRLAGGLAELGRWRATLDACELANWCFLLPRALGGPNPEHGVLLLIVCAGPRAAARPTMLDRLAPSAN